MARVSTPFSEKLGLRLPLIAAPMAGGPTTPELVAACAMWAGQGSALSRALPGAELIDTLEKETIAALRSGAALIKE